MGERPAIVPSRPTGALLHLPAYVRTVTGDEAPLARSAPAISVQCKAGLIVAVFVIFGRCAISPAHAGYRASGILRNAAGGVGGIVEAYPVAALALSAVKGQVGSVE